MEQPQAAEQQIPVLYSRYFTFEIPFMKRLKLLVTGKTYARVDHDPVGMPMHVDVLYDKPAASAFTMEEAEQIAQQVDANRQAALQALQGSDLAEEIEKLPAPIASTRYPEPKKNRAQRRQERRNK